jgi:hypothetical protein
MACLIEEIPLRQGRVVRIWPARTKNRGCPRGLCCLRQSLMRGAIRSFSTRCSRSYVEGNGARNAFDLYPENFHAGKQWTKQLPLRSGRGSCLSGYDYHLGDHGLFIHNEEDRPYIRRCCNHQEQQPSPSGCHTTHWRCMHWEH